MATSANPIVPAAGSTSAGVAKEGVKGISAPGAPAKPADAAKPAEAKPDANATPVYSGVTGTVVAVAKPAPDAAKAKGTMRYLYNATPGPNEKVHLDLIDLFGKLYPDVTVEKIRVPDDAEGTRKLLAMIGALLGFRALPYTLLVGSLVGLFVGVPLTLIARARRGANQETQDGAQEGTKDKTPLFQIKLVFGPFLAFGAFLYLLLLVGRDVDALLLKLLAPLFGETV